MTLSADAPFLDSKLGLGLTFTNDKLGVTRQTQFQTTYAYKIGLGKGNLSFGLGAGLITTNTAWSDLVVLDPGDEYYLINSRVFVVPDFSFGAYYTYQNYFAGLSIPKLLNYQFDLNAHVSYIDRFWAGLSYRNSRSLAALFQFAVNNQFRVAYTYDFDFGRLGRYSNGSHEIMLRYEFKYKVDVVNPLAF